MYLNQNHTVATENTVAVVTPPRTASRSVRDCLVARLGWTAVAGHHAFDADLCLDIKNAGGRVLVVVRNHWDALASWWARPDRSPSLTMATWVEAVVQGREAFAADGRLWGRYLEVGTALVTFEALEAELTRGTRETVVLEHEGRSSRRRGVHYSALYTEAQRDAVDRYFRAELDRLASWWGLRYEFEGEPSGPVAWDVDEYARPGQGEFETEEAREAYVSRPIVTREVEVRLEDLVLGYRGRRIAFDWRPYEERRPAARKDYDRLAMSIQVRGVRRPLIVYEGHVLVGQRRAEIARSLGIETVRAVEVLEDVASWWKYDVERLNRLKQTIGETAY